MPPRFKLHFPPDAADAPGQAQYAPSSQHCSGSFSDHRPRFSFLRLGGEPRFGWGGSSRTDVLLLRVARRPDPRTLRAVSAGLHGGDPGGAAVRGPVEALPWHWHGDDNHQGGQVYTTHARRKKKNVDLHANLAAFMSFNLKKNHTPPSICLSVWHTHTHLWRVIMRFTCRPLSVRAFMSWQVIPDVGEPAELLLINLSAPTSRLFSLCRANSPKNRARIGSWPADPAGRDLYPRSALRCSPPVEKNVPKRALMSPSGFWRGETPVNIW